MPEAAPPPDDFAGLSLTEIAALVRDQEVSPVEQWNPAHCGHSAMRIARDGTWFHEGAPIARPAMVRQFARILRREPDGSFVLVTPAEKLTIDVDDAPFVAIEMKSEGEGPDRSLAFRLNTEEMVVAGPEHGLRVDLSDDGPRPYLHVRGGLEARIERSVYYELASLALDGDADAIGVWSDGVFFALAPE